MNSDNYWYNIKDNNGNITIEKIAKKEDTTISDVVPVKEINEKTPTKKNWRPAFLIVSLLIVLPFLIIFLINNKTNNEQKYRTFMIYMVGSDLESGGSIATYDLNDIKGNNIDLNNNNVLLMVGGSKKWHNFVNEDEVGLYELTKSGFKKVKSYKLSSMGKEDTLSSFLSYTTDNYKSEKYDMIFWNHGLGAIGLEADEVFDDYLNINELNNVFAKSKFSKEKLEIVIFNSCMSGNIHIASVMKNYANYMVASEEVMYVGSIINRLDFLNDVSKNDNGYDIGLSYIKRSDSSINYANSKKSYDLDSTLSIIDLSKIDEVEKNMSDYFNSIDLESSYKAVSRLRRRSITYGEDDNSFDTIDLYSLANSLEGVSNKELKESLQESIKKAVIYNSTLNEYSNGLSIYFPYYGTEEYITSHLYYFDKLWNNGYTSFVHQYVNLSSGAKRANRNGNDEEVLLLTNDIKYENDILSLELTEDEKEKYQDANVYIFEKNNDKYKLLLKTDEIELEDNKLMADTITFLKTSNNKVISAIKENGVFKIYGSLNNSDLVIKLSNKNGFGIIKNIFVDSKDNPIGGLIEYNDEKISYYSINYNMKEKLTKEWNIDTDKELLNNIDNEISIVGNDLSNYYALVEMHDVNNDVFYSRLIKL